MIESSPPQSNARTYDRPPDAEHARRCRSIQLACLALLLAAAGSAASPVDLPGPQSTSETPPAAATAPATGTPRLPRLAPDAIDVVIPPNLAPLNFVIQEPGTEYQLRLSGRRGQPLELRQPQPQIRLPLQPWKELLEVNRGSALRWEVSVRTSSGAWVDYAPFQNQVAEEPIDPWIVYRRLQPLYTSYKHLGIYQRNLESFEEKPVVRNDAFDHGCVNCHTFQQGSPDRFAISFRGRTGTPTLLIESNHISRIDKKLGYLSWHPSGKLLAFSENTITQFFHIAGPLNRDVYDPYSDINVFRVDNRTVEKPAVLTAPDRSENWPSWSTDGRYLYFCSAPSVAFREERNFRFDLLRVPYDLEQNTWGQPETLISGAESRLSAHQPRESPDGRYLLFTVCESGSFPLFRPDSDLCLLRLDTRKWERLPVNSDQADTWPCWSSNGRWLTFVSRGLDGVFARIMIAHADSAARFSKPLLLPQEDPAYYETCLDNFNAPELARGPIRIPEEELVRVFKTPGSQTPLAGGDMSESGHGADRPAASDDPYR